MTWHCGECGSTRLLFSLGDCDRCGKSLDGEPNPVSRTSGMYHRRCWLTFIGADRIKEAKR